MSMLISIVFLIGVMNEPRIEKNRILIYVAIGLASVTLLLSGSRTTYVGIIFFLLYFFLTQTGRFIVFVIIGTFLFGVVLLFTPTIVDRISETLENRVTYAMEDPGDVIQYRESRGVYDELSAGRVELHMKYVEYLLNHPYVIPFGRGFMNRMGVGNSAHNMYLSLISEVGILGLILFIRWLLSFMLISKGKMPGLQLALNGLIIAMMVTLYFGEHLYVYRPLFALLGYFILICIMLTIPLRNTK
ncbi:O-antigen ligase domain-containing protein [Aequorivita sp. H23M31]|uniref:O-antigen ligase domain-containing protein n=1 Tax=Aequorivita ciconiae TaxID=2494375 RepID=A0A410G274_9FLAO|nr:O-antigen ligase family protein [Aequorivita sp. H23M31]QAA81362.1 O-antigen ligase domain-containing protein [Aequorivita sp. H23M31]